MRVSVIGGGEPADREMSIAEEVGECLGERGHTVVCGGLSGVMEAVCRGAKQRGGSTIGILPRSDPRTANPYVDVPIATGMGNARNVLVVMNGDGVIAIDGQYGTLSEIGHALDFGRPVVGITSPPVEGVVDVESAVAAVDFIEESVPSPA